MAAGRESKYGGGTMYWVEVSVKGNMKWPSLTNKWQINYVMFFSVKASPSCNFSISLSLRNVKRNILQKMCGWEEDGKVKDLDIKSVFDGTGTVG